MNEGSELGLGEKIVNDLGIELGLTVCATSRRYRQTNSAQTLKETNMVHMANSADPCSYGIRVRVRVRKLSVRKTSCIRD